jgi:hypothetical protein
MKRSEALKSVVRFRDDSLVTVGGGVFLGCNQILSLSTVVRNALGWRDACRPPARWDRFGGFSPGRWDRGVAR